MDFLPNRRAALPFVKALCNMSRLTGKRIERKFNFKIELNNQEEFPCRKCEWETGRERENEDGLVGTEISLRLLGEREIWNLVKLTNNNHAVRFMNPWYSGYHHICEVYQNVWKSGYLNQLTCFSVCWFQYEDTFTYCKKIPLHNIITVVACVDIRWDKNK